MVDTDRLNEADRSNALRATNRQWANAQMGGLKAAPCGSLSQLVPGKTLPFRRTIRRAELRQIVPLGDTTIYEMERRGEFPRRFYLTSRCVVWDLAEVEAWVDARRQAADTAQVKTAPAPDVTRRKLRPVKAARAL